MVAASGQYTQPSDKDRGDTKRKLEEDGIAKLAACRVWKSLWDLDLRECYFFAAPQRQRMLQSYSPPPQQRLLDAAELNTEFAFEVCGDFATEVINTYMPEAQEWCERGKGLLMPQALFDRIAKDVQEADREIFAGMRGSNLYSELSKAFDPDLAIGTVGLWIDPGPAGQPINVSAIPIRELEIDLGPYGEIDVRFAVRHTRNCYVRTLVGEEIWGKLDAETKKACDDKPTQRTMVQWGFWRLWDRNDDEVWQHVVFVDNKLVHDAELVGEGCCPLIVFRWNPNPDWPWGHGPLLQALPVMRQIDEMEIMRMEHGELSMRPPMTFPDDSFTAIEQGLEPGMAYPIRPGGADSIKRIYDVPPPEAENYQYEEKKHSTKKLFFVDFPEQTGDTPPTLGQWLDQMARAQRRIGRPGLPFWREGPAKIFLRFKYLMERMGAVKPIVADGRAVSLMPYNPAQRAAEQQEIAMAVQGLQMCAQFFPEEFKAFIDGQGTMKALLDKMRVELVKWRSKDQVDAAVNRIGQLLGGTPPGGILKGPQPQQQVPA